MLAPIVHAIACRDMTSIATETAAPLTGRVALVTGASGGIGAGLARMLAAEGARVILAARQQAALDQVADSIRELGGRADSIVTDLTDDASLANLIERARVEIGPIELLINNAGFAVWKPLEATSLAEWDHTFAVNVRAAAYLCASVLPDMQRRGFGRIVNIGSEAGVAIVPGLAAYCVSKHALRALTEVIQDGNHTNGIKAWVVCPGFVDTDMGYVVPGANPGNFLRVDEVVDVVRYLLHTSDNVKLGPEILVRTMRNPMSG
jgi:short-subunit dehydrogenase